MEFRDLDVGETFFLEACFEGLLYIVFAVDDEEGFDLFWILAGEELREVFVVAVGAHAADAAYFRIDLVEDAEDMYLFGSGYQSASERMGFAIAYEQYRVAAVLDVIADMVFDASGVGHAAGRDDDAGFVLVVEQFGFFHRFDVFQAAKGKGVVIGLENLPDRIVEILRIRFDDLRGGDAQRAVDIIIQLGQTAFFFELVEREQQLLGTAYAKRRDDELSFFFASRFY